MACRNNAFWSSDVGTELDELSVPGIKAAGTGGEDGEIVEIVRPASVDNDGGGGESGFRGMLFRLIVCSGSCGSDTRGFSFSSIFEIMRSCDNPTPTAAYPDLPSSWAAFRRLRRDRFRRINTHTKRKISRTSTITPIAMPAFAPELSPLLEPSEQL